MGRFWGIVIGAERKWRAPRLWSNTELRRFAPLFQGDVVNVSAWKDQDKQGGHYRDYFTNAASYATTNWTGERGAEDVPDSILVNLEAQLPEDLAGAFDVVYNHTTLEHVFDVSLAVKNLCDMSRDIVIVVVPFLQETHVTDDFSDYWRFTPFAMRRLFEQNGATVIHESLSEPQVNTSIYLFAIASKQPEKWSDKIPSKQLDGAGIGAEAVRNDPFSLLGAALYRTLARFAWYRRFGRRFARKHLKLKAK